MDYLSKIQKCFFKSELHERKFKELINIINDYNTFHYKDPQYIVTAYILSSIDKSFKKYINSDGIDFPELLDCEIYSSGERRMAQLACTLFNGYVDIGVNELFNHIDDENYCIAMSAINFMHNK